MGILKFSAVVGGTIGAFMAVSTFSSPVKSKDRFVDKCISGYEVEKNNPLLANVDKAGFCGCMADAGIQNDFSYAVMKPCIDVHMQKPIVKFCEDDLSPKLDGYVNCESIYENSAEWVFKSATAARNGVKISQADETQASINMINECEFK